MLKLKDDIHIKLLEEFNFIEITESVYDELFSDYPIENDIIGDYFYCCSDVLNNIGIKVSAKTKEIECITCGYDEWLVYDFYNSKLFEIINAGIVENKYGNYNTSRVINKEQGLL